MIGQTFGRWTVIGEGDPYVWRDKVKPRLLCRCSCGVERSVMPADLREGRSVSCGCFNREISRQVNTTHGKSDSAEHRIWRAMIGRCYNPKNSRYADYGGRGVGVCDRWRNDFQAFYDDMGAKPSPFHSIERENNSLGYSKENCKWATPHEQMTNRRCTLKYEVDGVEIPVSDLALKYGIPANTLRFRLLKGWPFEKAVSAPVRPKKSARS